MQQMQSFAIPNSKRQL